MDSHQQAAPLIFVKLGGSLITDKRHRRTPRRDLIRRLATELGQAIQATPSLRIVLGHGSGSFGHWEANQYGTHRGVATPEQWYGFAQVSAAALQLNRIVTDAFIEAGVPVLSLQPAASALAEHGHVTRFELDPLRRALQHGLIPLIFGDVAFDDDSGGTILSTEDIFAYLAQALHPAWILLLGNAPGVLDDKHKTIPLITPETYPQVQACLSESSYTDVTGGMADKVHQMVTLVINIPNLQVRIMSGTRPGDFREVLRDPEHHTNGTLIRAATRPQS
ncbi:MAG: isopentenyl phosphate kinase family protein [Anaerolineae bacterium]|nr:isopentenyl phosphate kinase family protein [Anaerolineae bacterium]